jgi:hypothetical protein
MDAPRRLAGRVVGHEQRYLPPMVKVIEIHFLLPW